MMTTLAGETLRAGLLRDVSVLVAAAASEEAAFADAVSQACTGLAARVRVRACAIADEAAVDELVVSVLADLDPLDLLVVDGAALFAQGGLRVCLDAAWNVTRAVVNLAFLPDASSPPTRRIVYLAPSPHAGEHADAARAGLENLARTLSIEWARYGITVVTIAPGNDTSAGEVAALTAYLASPAGGYFSGCLLDLRGS